MAADAFILQIGDFPGLGDCEYPGFPADVCPETLPDLLKHHSVVADVLKQNPSMYEQLRNKRTAFGVSLAKCIKTGMDNRGHPMIKTLGAVAADEECYEVFRPLFDALIRTRHGEHCLRRPHASAACPAALSTLRPDPTERYVLSVQVRAARNFRGMRFPPACSLEERREVERVAARALLELEGPLQGHYHPLRGSRSYPWQAGGMSLGEEAELLRAGMLFSYPDSSAALCSGIGRHWPDARGVFVSETRGLSVWVNEEEHLRVVAVRRGDNLQGAFQQLMGTFEGMVASLRRHTDCPKGFAYSERLGFLTSCPSNLGTAMRVSVIVRLPLIAAQEGSKLTEWCSQRNLAARSAIDESGSHLKGVMEISNRDRIGVSETETANLVINSVAELVRAERLLEHGGAGLELPLAVKCAARAAPCTPVASEQDEATWEMAGNTLGLVFAHAVAGGGPGLRAGAEPPAGPQLSAEDAATRIQAVHRGNASRAQRRCRPVQTAVGTKSAAGNSSADAGAPAHGSQTACLIGSGEAAPAVAANSLADIKVRTAAMLERAVESGTLGNALGSLASNTSGIEDVRKLTAEVLFSASQTGELTQVLAALGLDEEAGAARIRSEPLEEGEQGVPQALSEEAAAVRIQALHRGNAARSALGRESEIDRIREAMKSTLEGALEDGSLERLFSKDEGIAEGSSEVRRSLKARLEGALGDGSLEKLLQSSEFSDEPLEQSLADLEARKLDEWNSTGNLKLSDVTRHSLRAQAALDVEDIRSRLKASLHEAVEDGSLDQAFNSPADNEEAIDPCIMHEAPVNLEDVRSRMFMALEGAAEDGSLAGLFGNQQTLIPGFGDAIPSSVPDVDELREGLSQEPLASYLISGSSRGSAMDKALEVATTTHLKRTPLFVGTALSECARALLEAVSGCDRKIGLLNATITEVRRCIREREEQSVQLEAELEATRQETQCLDAEIENHQRLTDQAEALSLELVNGQRKLVDEINCETMKRRHAEVDFGMGLFSFRSETSTACTLCDIATPLQLNRDIKPVPLPSIFTAGRT